MAKTVLISGLAWAALSAPLHLVWEAFHIRFYTIWQEASIAQLAYAVLHCTAGDVLIAFVTFAVVAAGVRDADWPSRAPWRGVPLLLASGLVYTVASEWFNVYRLGRWAYAQDMPMIGGIGATPIAQWLLVPLASLALYRHLRLPRGAWEAN